MYKLGLERKNPVKFRALLVSGVIFALALASLTVSGQDIQYSVELECEQKIVSWWNYNLYCYQPFYA